MYVKIILLYILKLHNVIFQLCLNKAGKIKEKNILMDIQQNTDETDNSQKRNANRHSILNMFNLMCN